MTTFFKLFSNSHNINIKELNIGVNDKFTEILVPTLFVEFFLKSYPNLSQDQKQHHFEDHVIRIL